MVVAMAAGYAMASASAALLPLMGMPASVPVVPLVKMMVLMTATWGEGHVIMHALLA